jgi:hypothetical protein
MSRNKTKNMAKESIDTSAMFIDNGVTNTEETKTKLLICAYPGTESLMQKIWAKFLDFGSFQIISVSSDSIVDTLARLNENGELPEECIFVPANTFPTAPIQRRELHTSLVYVTRDGKRTFAHRLPHVIKKSFLSDFISNTSSITDEDFCKKQIDDFGFRPVEVGFAFGNYVCPVLRGNPCEHTVLEAFLRKKFITASREGFGAIEHLVRKLADN